MFVAVSFVLYLLRIFTQATQLGRQKIIRKNELILYGISLGSLCSPMQAFCYVVSEGQLKGTLKATTT